MNFSEAAITTTYHYQLKTDDKGVTYFETGPETIICEFVTFQYEPSKEFMDAILNGIYNICVDLNCLVIKLPRYNVRSVCNLFTG